MNTLPPNLQEWLDQLSKNATELTPNIRAVMEELELVKNCIEQAHKLTQTKDYRCVLNCLSDEAPEEISSSLAADASSDMFDLQQLFSARS